MSFFNFGGGSSRAGNTVKRLTREVGMKISQQHGATSVVQFRRKGQVAEAAVIDDNSSIMTFLAISDYKFPEGELNPMLLFCLLRRNQANDLGGLQLSHDQEGNTFNIGCRYTCQTASMHAKFFEFLVDYVYTEMLRIDTFIKEEL